ncbi:MAG: DUF3800 domain-containing protein [Oscillospiraceae bacterium]|jgi:hypothetical protein|nr:DUF3800 domain-containing protein [Oscillospiraceae bacterium]
MTTLHLDESGNMGFDFNKKGTSRYFSINLLILNECRPVISLVKRVYLTLPRANKRKSSGVLHAYHEKPSTRTKLLKGLSQKNIKIASIHLDKQNVLVTSKPHDIYTSMVVTLLNRLYTDGVISGLSDIRLIASKRNTSKYLNDDFLENVITHTKSLKFSAVLETPSNNKCLQSVDFISWSMYQKLEKNDFSYYELFADKVVHEYLMYD